MQLTFRNVNIIIQVKQLETVPPPSLNELMKNPEYFRIVDDEI